MTQPNPLPQPLRGHPFSVAEARAAGVGVERLRRGDLAAPHYGVRERRVSDEVSGAADEVLDRHRAYVPRLRAREMFWGVSAAALWGAPLPPQFSGAPLEVAVGAPSNPARGKGVLGHQVRAPNVVTRIRTRFALPVADPATTWISLATRLNTNDLVAVGDYFAHQPVYATRGEVRPYATLEELASRVQTFRGRGKSRASGALEHICTGAESRRESLLRMLIHDAGLPPPEVNPQLYDRGGAEIGRADLVYQRWKVIVEYDGDQHRTDDTQYDRDMLRLERFHLDGWSLLRFRKHALFVTPTLTVARIELALRRAGWTPTPAGRHTHPLAPTRPV